MQPDEIQQIASDSAAQVKSDLDRDISDLDREIGRLEDTVRELNRALADHKKYAGHHHHEGDV